MRKNNAFWEKLFCCFFLLSLFLVNGYVMIKNATFVVMQSSSSQLDSKELPANQRHSSLSLNEKSP